jgi:hypothetical protein
VRSAVSAVGERPFQGVVVAPVHGLRVPACQLEPGGDATSPTVSAAALSITTTVSMSSRAVAAYGMPSKLLPSSSSPSPISTTTRGRRRPWARSASAVPTAIGSPWPSDPLEISTPGIRVRSGCMPSGESNVPKVGSTAGSRNPRAARTA